MNVKKNEFVIGVVMIIAALLLVFGIFWLGNSNFFIKGLPINVRVENARGISIDDAVYFRGMKVGSVRSASIQNDAVILGLKVEGMEKISVDSKFIIKDLSFIGGKIIEIVPGTSHEYLQEEDTVSGMSDQSISEIMDEFKDLKPRIDKILVNTDTLTGSAMINELKETIHALRVTINSTNRIINGGLSNTISDVQQITTENKENITNLISSLNKNSLELSNFLNQSSLTVTALDTLIRGINGGSGSIGAIVKYDSLYHNLNNTIVSIDSLVSDLKKNPSKYINVSVF